jgi:hypothetical protein
MKEEFLEDMTTTENETVDQVLLFQKTLNKALELSITPDFY